MNKKLLTALGAAVTAALVTFAEFDLVEFDHVDSTLIAIAGTIGLFLPRPGEK